MKLWRSLSLTTRTTLLFGLVALVVMGVLGMYFYQSARVALELRTDTQLIGRVDHFRRLVDNVYTVSELEQRPLLFETMLGAEEDVLLFRRPGEAPFIHVNPANLPVPTLPVVPFGVPLTRQDVHRIVLPDGTPVEWVLATAKATESGDAVEVVAAHPLMREVQMLAVYRARILLSIFVAVLASTVLGYLVISRGLRPVRHIAERAAEISPANLSIRLSEQDAPPELRLMTRSFNAMLDRLADGYERLSQFSADLAHEIRTPVGALIGTTQVTLGQTRNVDEYQAVLESNLEELNRLKTIAENILFLAHAEHAALVIERSDIALGDELNKIAEYFEGPADERGLTFNVKAAGVAWVNPVLCRRAVNNLVVNAVRYARANSVVRMFGEQDARGAAIVVENDGEAIPSDQLARLFDRFYRGDVARSRFTESNGLGLSIVRAIMTLHGGTAEVSCPKSGVVRFELRFPAAQVA
ncbi:heavy metal sensor histidine kinase [Pararobbsia alpina]|uniref:Sensor protein n=1 Tax=Pararobbsia alpina TaxID=621374 RepID=A0A6S7DDG1_9BURK|nr:heavy metal sensor histidine kinase [Pararobbsia alpina]CAB3802352.1 Sensor protein CzcS [Pararobbsia alpina]